MIPHQWAMPLAVVAAAALISAALILSRPSPPNRYTLIDARSSTLPALRIDGRTGEVSACTDYTGLDPRGVCTVLRERGQP